MVLTEPIYPYYGDAMTLQRGPTIKRGETYQRFLLVRSGDPSGAVCRTVLKPARSGEVPGDTTAEAAVFTVSWVDHYDPEDPTSSPAWLCVLSPEQTASLRRGTYVTDARIEVAGFVQYTMTETVEIVERVTQDG